MGLSIFVLLLVTAICSPIASRADNAPPTSQLQTKTAGEETLVLGARADGFRKIVLPAFRGLPRLGAKLVDFHTAFDPGDDFFGGREARSQRAAAIKQGLSAYGVMLDLKLAPDFYRGLKSFPHQQYKRAGRVNAMASNLLEEDALQPYLCDADGQNCEKTDPSFRQRKKSGFGGTAADEFKEVEAYEKFMAEWWDAAIAHVEPAPTQAYLVSMVHVGAYDFDWQGYRGIRVNSANVGAGLKFSGVQLSGQQTKPNRMPFFQTDVKVTPDAAEAHAKRHGRSSSMAFAVVKVEIFPDAPTRFGEPQKQFAVVDPIFLLFSDPALTILLGESDLSKSVN